MSDTGMDQLAVVTGKRMFARVVQTTVSHRRWRVLHETNRNLLKRPTHSMSIVGLTSGSPLEVKRCRKTLVTTLWAWKGPLD